MEVETIVMLIINKKLFESGYIDSFTKERIESELLGNPNH